MKSPKQMATSPKIIGEVHLARIRLARAECQLGSAKQQSRLARRRRKEAKLAACRAKKQARQAKKELSEAKLALAQAEDKLTRLKQRPFRIKSGKKSVAAPQKKKPSRPAAIRLRASVKRAKPAPRSTPKRKATTRPIRVPGDVETPVATDSALVGMPTHQIEKGVEEILATDSPTHAALAPTPQPPEEEHSSTPNETIT